MTSSGVSTSTVGASEVVRGADTVDANAGSRGASTRTVERHPSYSTRARWVNARAFRSRAFTDPSDVRMRVLLQRVSRAEVRVREPDATARVTGRIERGFLLLVGFTH